MRKLFLIVALVGPMSMLFAQKKVLTFEEAIQLALRNGVLYNQQKNNLEFTQMQKLSGIASLGPSVQLNGQAYRVNGNSFNQQSGTVINGIRDQVNGSINVSMNLFSGFSRINSLRQFANQLDAQAYFTNRTSQDLVNAVAAQYLTVMLDVELLRIASENLEAQTIQLDQVRAQVQLGSRSQVDEYNQEALLKAAELRAVQAEVTLENDKATLSQTILIDPFEDFDVEKPEWDINAIGSEELNVQEMAEKAKASRGDYQRALRQEQAQRFAVQAMRGQGMPSLSAFFNYGSAYNFQHGVPDSISLSRTVVVADPSSTSGYSIQDETLPGMYRNPNSPRPFDEQFRTNNVYKTYGFQLTIPLFNGLQNKTNVKQQKVLYENSMINTKNIENQIKSDVVRAVKNFEGSKKALAVTNDQLSAADLAFRFETERYNLGITSQVDYANANRAFVQAQTDRAQAEYRLIFQKIMIEYALGTLKPESVSN